MNYEEVLTQLKAWKDETFRRFNERIANVEEGTSLGVRIPVLRSYARMLVKREDFSWEALDSFPNTYLEIRMLKCLCTGYAELSFEQLKDRVRKCIPVIDGWAVCDVFCSTLKEIRKHREEYLGELKNFIGEGKEFSQRFAYVLMLGCYMEREYLPFVFEMLDAAQAQYYYTMMGAAWLLAEVLVRFYAEGVAYLQEGKLADAAKNKAIVKACESFRVDAAQKKFLKSLKK